MPQKPAKKKTVRTSLTEKEIDTLTSYADGEGRVLKSTGMSRSQLKEVALNDNIEKCPTCHWWAESHEFVDEESELDGHCMNCRSTIED